MGLGRFDLGDALDQPVGRRLYAVHGLDATREAALALAQLGVQLRRCRLAPQFQFVGRGIQHRAQAQRQPTQQALRKVCLRQPQRVAHADVLLMPALNLDHIRHVRIELRRRRHLQRKTELRIELAEGAAQHVADLLGRRLRALQQPAHARQRVAIHLAQTQLQHAALQRLGKRRHLGLERARTHAVQHIAHHLQMHHAQRLHLARAGVEVSLLQLDTPTHGVNHVGVLAAQAVEFGHLVVQIATANVEHARGLGMQAVHAVGHGTAQNRLAAAQNAFGQRLLQMRQAAGLQQHVITVDLGDQTLLCRHRHHLAERHAQDIGGRAALLIELVLHLRGRVERIPQRVDLVEHDQPRFVAFGRRTQMLAPDGQIRARDAGVRAQNKHHGMRLRDQVDGQFGLGTYGVQTRRIQNHQPLLEQRMRHIDQRMAPARHLDHVLRVGQRIVIRRIVVPETQRARFVNGHTPHLGHLGQRLGHLLSVVDLQRNLGPLLLLEPPLGKPLRLQPRLDRQQTQAGGRVGFVRQFGRAHRSAPGTCRHDAPPVARKKDCIDQL
ncbi:hypothetical protein SDC9_80293 [bioreactor metagenome]|uniref:Uncharacterized protein n=1 Tax=bioreactor metagenome TaxID=1076179 RepID=A0A644YYL5_9ZZZZ